MRDRALEILITAKDLTANAVGKFRRRWRAVGKVVRDVTRSVAAFTAAASAAAFGLQKLGERGDEVNAVKRAFARITDDETAALRRLREASSGTIADFKLMSLANQAMTLGAASSVDQFAEMVEVSRALGRAQGVDALSALESLTIGLARQSPRILDNIGLQIKLGDTTTFAARAMAQAREKAEELTGGFRGSESWATRFSTALANGRDRLAEFVAGSPEVARFFDGLTETFTAAVDAIEAQDWDGLADLFKVLGRIMADAWVIGWNEAFAALPENTAFDRFFLNLLPARVREWMEGLDLQGRVGRSGADEGRANLSTDLKSLGEVVARLRAGAAVSGGSGNPNLPRAPGPISDDELARRVAGITGPGVRFDASGRASGLAVHAPFLSPGAVNAPGVGALGLTDHQRRVQGFLGEASESISDASEVAAASMFGAARAVIGGSQQIEQSVVGMVTNILQSLPGVGGLAGTLIGGVGGLIGAALGRRNRPVSVRVSDIDDTAAAKLRENSREPIHVTSIMEMGGLEVGRLERVLHEREQHDATRRL